VVENRMVHMVRTWKVGLKYINIKPRTISANMTYTTHMVPPQEKNMFEMYVDTRGGTSFQVLFLSRIFRSFMHRDFNHATGSSLSPVMINKTYARDTDHCDQNNKK